MGRKLDDAEVALWRKVASTVKPLRPGRLPEASPQPQRPPPELKQSAAAVTAPAPRLRRSQSSANTLDGSWDRRLARGIARPDLTVDLHDHSLASAHALLDRRLGEAIASGARLLLLITGKPPQPGRSPSGRGAIRGAIADWLAVSRHGPQIAAVRHAHPRHGGSGALYVILRRKPGQP